ncbi:hypothetical protein [Rhodopila sp.]
MDRDGDIPLDAFHDGLIAKRGYAGRPKIRHSMSFVTAASDEVPALRVRG